MKTIKYHIQIVKIYDHYGFIITDLRNGKVITSEMTYPLEMVARNEAIEIANLL